MSLENQHSGNGTQYRIQELEDKVDALVEAVDSLSDKLLILEFTTVKKEGPLAERLFELDRSYDRLKDSVLTKEEYRLMVENAHIVNQRNRDRGFSHREKLAALVISLVVVVTQLYTAIRL